MHDALKHEYCIQLTAVMSSSLEQNVIESGNEDFKEPSPVYGLLYVDYGVKVPFMDSRETGRCFFPGSLKISSAMCTSISILC